MSAVADERRARTTKDHTIDRLASLVEDAAVIVVVLALLALVAAVIVAALVI